MLYKKYHRSYIRKFRKGKKVIRLGCFISYKATVTRLVVSNRDTFSTYIYIYIYIYLLMYLKILLKKKITG